MGTVQPLSSLVGADILYDMNTDDLLQKHGQELVSLYGKLLESGNVNGRQLAIPAKQFNSEKKAFIIIKPLQISLESQSRIKGHWMILKRCSIR